MSMPTGVPELCNWRKSERSIANGDCAEVASSATGVFIRDTKDQAQLTLCYPASSWRSFVSAVRTGAYDSFN